VARRLRDVLAAGRGTAAATDLPAQRVRLEFVSANPTARW
jgi:arginyl-tRNA synthetase